MRRLLFLSLFLVLLGPCASASDSLHLVRYDDMGGLSEWRVSDVLQDSTGFLWVATWNGLNRYDGYAFARVADRTPEGPCLPVQHIRAMLPGGDGGLWCRLEDSTIYRFDRRRYEWQRRTWAEWVAVDGSHPPLLAPLSHDDHLAARRAGIVSVLRAGYDAQGTIWGMLDGGMAKLTRQRHKAAPLPGTGQLEARAFMADSGGRLWVATREDEAVCLYADSARLGFLGGDGRLRQDYTSFGAKVYCICQDRQGYMWMGAKHKGLFRLTPRAGGTWQVEHIDVGASHVYDLAEDSEGRLWVATQDAGLRCMEHPGDDRPEVAAVFGEGLFFRRLLLTRGGLLLGATGEGLMAARVAGRPTPQVSFTLHRNEPGRDTSLGGHAVADIVEDAAGRVYVGTDCGIDGVDLDRLADGQPAFTHLTRSTDVMLAMACADEQLLCIMGTYVELVTPATGATVRLGPRFWADGCRFSEARPLRLPAGRWLIGSRQGALVTSQEDWGTSGHMPAVVFTALTIAGGQPDLSVAACDTIRLSPAQRNFSLTYAALDFTDNSDIRYRTRMDGGGWTEMGANRTLTFFDLPPGTHRLQVCSTDAYGRWGANTRTLVIHATPTFGETPLAAMLRLLLTVAVVAAVILTLFYIRSLHRKQQETLEAYLSLLDTPAHRADRQPGPPAREPAPIIVGAAMKTEDEELMRHVMAFVEQNIGNADASISDMARAAAVSESGLYRKMNTLMGVSPGNFLQEARLQRAAQLLAATPAAVAEVAYQCGFTDPKYFGRCFKKRFSLSPSEYRKRNGG